jgi:AraC-like DNA-binding protein
MDTWQNFLVIFCGLGLVQNLFLSTILILKDKLSLNALFYSGILLLGLALRLGKSFFVFVPQRYPHPHWGVVAGGAGLWLIGPAFYLYTLHSLDPQRKSKLFYLVHFIPSVIILITGITDYVYYVGIVQSFIYFIFSIRRGIHAGARKIPNHFRVLAACVGVILLCFTLQAIKGGIEAYTVGTGVAIATLYVVNYFMVKDSDFFSSLARKPKVIERSLATRIIADLDEVFLEKKIYRNKGLTIAEVASQINHPTYLISQSINQRHGVRFNEFVNKFRVQEAMEKLKHGNDKVEAIAKDVGFSSTTSLYDAFKKETNLTPQGYRNQFVTS